MAYIDALASPGADSDRGSFGRFVKANFRELNDRLEACLPGKSGGDILYDRYRNGLLHGLGPKRGFAICTNTELMGEYAGEVPVEGMGRFVGINVERLVGDFLALVARLAEEASR
jgi:hypothetical protein